MFLDYFALGVLLFVVVTLFYAVIAIHDIPHLIAKARNHPHQDAIHVAGWVSLFTLHALWPFLWIWAMLYRPERGWGFAHGEADASRKLDELHRRVQELEARMQRPELAADVPQSAKRPKRLEPVADKALEIASKEGGA